MLVQSRKIEIWFISKWHWNCIPEYCLNDLPKVLEYEIVHWKNWNTQYRFFLRSHSNHKGDPCVWDLSFFDSQCAKPIISLVFRRPMIFIKEVGGNENNPLKISSIVGQNSLWCYKCDITPVAKRGVSLSLLLFRRSFSKKSISERLRSWRMP